MTFTGSAKELMVLQMKSLSKKTTFPSEPVDERLLTSNRFAGSALAWEQLLPGKMTLLDMMTPSSEEQ
jgi:hypothetical protein